MSNPDDPIKSIFFEHQQAALCAQHALNMLLQDSLFTYEDLRVLARQMDDMEQEILGNQANRVGHSENMNDSGFFSIQVIDKALDTFSLKLINIENPVMAEFKNNPLTARAFVCNLREHWFILRKFGAQWFELNSINHGPRLLSDTYVREFLHQVSAEGYSIFVVQGILPESYADQLIALCPVVPPPRTEKKEPNMVQKFFNSVGKRLGSAAENDTQEDKDLAIAMAMSMETNPEHHSGIKEVEVEEDEEELLKRAILESLQPREQPSQNSGSETEPKNFKSENLETSAVSEAIETPILSAGNSENPENSSSPNPPNIPSREQQRKDRQAFLDRLEKKE